MQVLVYHLLSSLFKAPSRLCSLSVTALWDQKISPQCSSSVKWTTPSQLLRLKGWCSGKMQGHDPLPLPPPAQLQDCGRKHFVND